MMHGQKNIKLYVSVVVLVTYCKLNSSEPLHFKVPSSYTPVILNTLFFYFVFRNVILN